MFRSSNIFSVILEIISYPSVLTFVLGDQKNRLIETVLLGTHSICFGCETRKLLFNYALSSRGLMPRVELFYLGCEKNKCSHDVRCSFLTICSTVVSGGLSEFQTKHEELCKSCLKPQEPKPLYSPTTPIIEPAIETETATQILPFLYLG